MRTPKPPYPAAFRQQMGELKVDYKDKGLGLDVRLGCRLQAWPQRVLARQAQAAARSRCDRCSATLR
jgi:hypothetical protein